MSSAAVMPPQAAAVRCEHCKLNQFDRAICRRCLRPLHPPSIDQMIDAYEAELSTSQMYLGACRDIDLPHALGIVIRRERKHRGMTQGELGLELGVTFSTIANWEHGDHTPYLVNLDDLAKAFDMRISKLIALAEQELKANTVKRLA